MVQISIFDLTSKEQQKETCSPATFSRLESMQEIQLSQAKANAEQWLDERFDEATREEVKNILKNPEVLLNHFLQPMEFGTAGLRGIMAAGISCMNPYTVAAASLGIARWQKKGRVVLAFDARKNSCHFAKLAAAILQEQGFSVLLFSEVTPTPLVPFVLLHGGADLGLVITASHNPPIYNGLKVYAANGAQIISPVDKEIAQEIAAIDILAAAEQVKKHYGKKITVEKADNFIAAYLDFITKKVLMGSERDISLVYTPLHGAAGQVMLAAFQKANFKQVSVVESQIKPNGNFPTIKAPNPEYPENLSQALLQAQMQKADLVLANDGDGDRIGLIVREKDGSYTTLDGNQIGCLLAYYLLLRRKQQNKLTGKELLISTVVSSPLLEKIAHAFGVAYHATLTGFKWMGNLAASLAESAGKELLLAYEEAFGVAVGGARDKDGISAALLAAEVAAWCKQQGKTLLDLLAEIYALYGFHLEGAYEEYYAGSQGQAKITTLINALRTTPPQEIGGEVVTEIFDYQSQTRFRNNKKEIDLTLTKQNMLVFKTAHCWLAIRPSGTEPKVKAYFGLALEPQSSLMAISSAKDKLAELKQTAQKILRGG